MRWSSRATNYTVSATAGGGIERTVNARIIMPKESAVHAIEMTEQALRGAATDRSYHSPSRKPHWRKSRGFFFARASGACCL